MDLHKAVRDRWVWGQAILIILIVIGAPLLPRYINLGEIDFMLNRIDPNWIRGIGVIVAALGAAILIWGVRSLGRNLTPEVEPLPDSQLVISGAYAHVRHPIYTGAVLMLSGYTLAWSNWTLALIMGGISLLYFDAKALAEENRLLQRHPSYRSYMRHVQRRIL
jgi:protein-S-isoprenylcysteine O-methyltransferase Ste14